MARGSPSSRCADVADGRGRGSSKSTAGCGRRGPLGEQADGGVRPQRRHGVHDLARARPAPPGWWPARGRCGAPVDQVARPRGPPRRSRARSCRARAAARRGRAPRPGPDQWWPRAAHPTARGRPGARRRRRAPGPTRPSRHRRRPGGPGDSGRPPRARRVLPTPPGPTSVTSRCDSSSRTQRRPAPPRGRGTRSAAGAGCPPALVDWCLALGRAVAAVTGAGAGPAGREPGPAPGWRPRAGAAPARARCPARRPGGSGRPGKARNARPGGPSGRGRSCRRPQSRSRSGWAATSCSSSPTQRRGVRARGRPRCSPRSPTGAALPAEPVRRRRTRRRRSRPAPDPATGRGPRAQQPGRLLVRALLEPRPTLSRAVRRSARRRHRQAGNVKEVAGGRVRTVGQLPRPGPASGATWTPAPAGRCRP